VARYDLFGRGLSDRPDVDYELELFVGQLEALVPALGLSPPIALVGLSMGGPICAAYATRFPERVRKLVLIDPAGARAFRYPLLLRVLKLPGVGEALSGALASPALLGPALSGMFGGRLVSELRSRYLVQMQYRGFRRALLSTLRSRILDSKIGIYRQVGELQISTLLLWGREDRAVPVEYNSELRQAIPQAELHVFDGCGHAPHFERPDSVNPILIRFLQN
jgi:pimeloyl-ACP methyl ester carboxylesterase